MLAACLAYLMNRQRDAVALTTFDDAITAMLPASARPGHLRSILLTLDSLALGNRTDVSKPLHLLADGIRKRGLVVLISDLLDEPERVVDGLRHFRFRGSDVIVFHLLDPAELTFPFERAARFRDMELGDELMAVPSVVRQQYLDALNQALDRFRQELGSAGIDYQLIDTSTPLDFALMSYCRREAGRADVRDLLPLAAVPHRRRGSRGAHRHSSVLPESRAGYRVRGDALSAAGAGRAGADVGCVSSSCSRCGLLR